MVRDDDEEWESGAESRDCGCGWEWGADAEEEEEGEGVADVAWDSGEELNGSRLLQRRLGLSSFFSDGSLAFINYFAYSPPR